MTGINVHVYIGEVQLLKRIRNSLTVSGSRGLASCQVDVGDQVGQRVGLNDQSEGDV